MAKPLHAWMVRAGNENELAPLVEKLGAVAIGWNEMGDVSGLHSRPQFKERYQEVYPDDSAGRMGINAGQVYRFTREIQEGDYILTYIKDSREVLIGLATGPYQYRTDILPEDYPHIRQVNWIKRVSRDKFSAPARNSLASKPTVFRLDDHLAEVNGLITTKDTVVTEEMEDVIPFFEEVSAKANELISDLISRLDPYDFQDLVAAVLRAIGFRAVSASPGRDRGVDVIAHPDALGFGPPRIKAQVKHRKGSTGGAEMRSFLGALRAGDKGLYVSTGGFTTDARLEAQQSRESITLLDRDEFIRLLLEHYEALEPKHKSKVPLRKVWVPTE